MRACAHIVDSWVTQGTFKSLVEKEIKKIQNQNRSV